MKNSPREWLFMGGVPEHPDMGIFIHAVKGKLVPVLN
jgi:hypothetical protein